jgi:hypothetical protein
MDLIAYIFATLYAVWPLLLLAFVCWVINACRNPIKRSVIYTPTPEQQAAADRKLRATIDLTSTADFGINVRRGHE